MVLCEGGANMPPLSAILTQRLQRFVFLFLLSSQAVSHSSLCIRPLSFSLSLFDACKLHGVIERKRSLAFTRPLLYIGHIYRREMVKFNVNVCVQIKSISCIKNEGVCFSRLFQHKLRRCLLGHRNRII